MGSPVADAVELGRGIVWIALVIVFGHFGLTLFESVDEIGLGEGLETEKRNAEQRGRWRGKSQGVFSRDALCICSALVATSNHKSEEGKNG